jgi:uncharacterized protein (TIGR00730 family)
VNQTPSTPPSGATDLPPGQAPAPTAAQAEAVEALLDAAGITMLRNHVARMITDALAMGNAGLEELDLKIASAALGEMRSAFAMFAPHRDVPKVAIFGSARVQPADPLYVQTRRAAELLALGGWKVITGAGPGLMTAAIEGAGRDHSFGVNIRLPFENKASSVVLDEAKSVAMKYFFTRKLMLIKESSGFICLPGGFGTMDEMFELLTLTQTGKGVPVPIVLLDAPGDPYWEGIAAWIHEMMVARGYVSDADCSLFRLTEDPAEAVDEIARFYATYDSIRYVGDLLVMRIKRPLDADEIAEVNDRFADLCLTGRIETVNPTRAEVQGDDRLHLARIALRFNPRKQGRLRQLIDHLNRTPPRHRP